MSVEATTDYHSARRRWVLRSGTIEFNGGAIDCTVRNLSSTGTLLEVVSPIGIPNDFTLVLPDGHQTACRIVWLASTRIGVTFGQRRCWSSAGHH
jgi:hypothetical protein